MNARWLFKTEPGTYAFSDLEREGKTVWSGIRNYQARNYLREVRPGDEILIYHTGGEKRVIGLAKALAPAYPETTPDGPDWVQIDIEAGERLPNPVPLPRLKGDPKLADLALFKNGRLSVIPITANQFAQILAHAQKPS